jgi:hypothetical protein
MRRGLVALIVTACFGAVGCSGDRSVAPDEDLTPKEVQTHMQEEAGIALRLNREHTGPTLALLVADDFHLWVYAADDWDNTLDKIGDLFNPAPGARVFGPWRDYKSEIIPGEGSRQVAVGFERGVVLRYIVSSKKLDRPCCDIPDPDWYEHVVERLSDLTGTNFPDDS